MNRVLSLSAKRHTDADGPTWDQLSRHQLILLSRGSSARSQFDRALLEHNPSAQLPQPRYDVTHIITAAAMARRGLGVAALPRLALPELKMTGLKARLIDSPGARRAIGLVHRRDRLLNPASQRFVDQVLACVPAVEAQLLPL